jgi:hypothetical protein
MNEQQPSEIFGLNFLQDMKGDPDEITGAYDPEQEIWIMEGQVQAMPFPKLPGHQPGTGLPGIEPPQPGIGLPTREQPGPRPRTNKDTYYNTQTPGGGTDNAWDEQRD